MKKNRLLRLSVLGGLLLTTIGFTLSRPALPTKAQTTYNLVWSDDFNGAVGSAPDSSKWGYDTGGGGWGNNEREDYTTSTKNASIISDSNAQDGKALDIKAIKENDGNQCWYGACQYTSARLLTKNKYTLQYGRVEVRAKLPIGQGMWPAFWMLGSDIDTNAWPNCGEMDIMETIGTDITNNHGSIHGPGYSGGSDRTATYTLPNGAKLSDAYHTFRIDWTQDQIQWFVDGNLYETRTPSDVSPNNWVFNHSFFMLLNFAVGGSWPGDPDGTSVFPQDLLVDYVHVYQTGAATATPAPSGDGNPYSGTAIAIPGKIEAENYNTGGEGVAYHDADTANQGGQYRTGDGVDIETTSDTNGGYDIGWTAKDEWEKYTVNVTTAGNYDFDFRVASAQAGSGLHLEVDGTNVTNDLAVPNTGGWQTWNDVTKTGVNLSAGSHVLRLYVDNAGYNINWINVTKSASSATSTNTPAPTKTNTPAAVTSTNTPAATATSSSSDGSPYSGTAVSIPGKVEAENYNTGGEGVAYHDADTANQGGQYRTGDGVDIETTSDTNGGYDIGWTAKDEWEKYTVNVSTAGNYDFDFRVASAQAGSGLHLEVDGTNVTNDLAVPNTGGWQTWSDVTKTGVNLSAGSHVLRLYVDNAGYNINWINVTKSASSATSTNTATFVPATNTPTGATATKTNTPVPPTATSSSSYPAWNGNSHPYNVGDMVSYNGNVYKCIQAHTSQPTWDPVDAPSLWQFVS